MTTTTPTRPARSPRPGRSVMGRRLDSVTGKVAIPELATFYIAWWPELEVLKVGRAWKENSRLVQLEQSGAVLLWFEAKTPESYEAGAIAILHETVDLAFTSRAEAEAAGIPGGTGWSECFSVPTPALEYVRDIIIFEGLTRYEYGPSPAALARRADQRRDARPADVGTAAVEPAEVAADEPGTVAAEPPSDESGRVPVRRGRHPRQPHARRAHARRARTHRDERRPRRPRALPDHGPDNGAVDARRPALTGRSQRTHSDGRKRERKGERARERERPAAPRGLSAEAHPACPLLRRPHAPRPRTRTMCALPASPTIRQRMDRSRQGRSHPTRRPLPTPSRHLRRPETRTPPHPLRPRTTALAEASSSSAVRCAEGCSGRSGDALVCGGRRPAALTVTADLIGARDA